MAFKGINFIITGAAGAIAEPLIERLFQLKANMLLIDVKKEKLEKIKLKYNSTRLKFVTSDLSSKSITDKIVNEYNKKIYGLVHLAGVFELDKNSP